MAATEKISVTMDREALHWLRLRAKRLHRGNLSAVIVEATESLRKLEAMDRLLSHLDAPELKPGELDALRADWHGEPKRRRPATKRK
jgi:hypothetical protein